VEKGCTKNKKNRRKKRKIYGHKYRGVKTRNQPERGMVKKIGNTIKVIHSWGGSEAATVKKQSDSVSQISKPATKTQNPKKSGRKGGTAEVHREIGARKAKPYCFKHQGQQEALGDRQVEGGAVIGASNKKNPKNSRK